MTKKNNKKENKLSNKIDVIVTILYTLVFCYAVYALLIIPEKLDASNIIILAFLLIPYLLRLLGKGMQLAIVALEITIIIFAVIIYISWPTIKSSISYDCGWGETN